VVYDVQDRVPILIQAASNSALKADRRPRDDSRGSWWMCLARCRGLLAIGRS